MKKFIFSFFALAIFVSAFTSCQPKAEINQDDVTRLITTLASDEMEGRGIFSPGLEKAADFIAEEFEKAGLEYLDGMNSYEQRFPMYTLTKESLSASLNGRSLNENEVIAAVDA